MQVEETTIMVANAKQTFKKGTTNYNLFDYFEQIRKYSCL